ncbi:MAG: exonuclease domain-containing protein [Bacteroidota bacterium]|nr:exonuclease domain-containing protein [Bacteroidota bacterium]
MRTQNLHILVVILQSLYAIVDIETTGGSPRKERITEIAVYIFDGEKIIDEFCSLVNPERNIPYYITNLTGITNEMVADAPKFYEIAREIVEITEGKTFVAHNARFDYSFIRQEFKSLGYNYKRSLLDTVSLSCRFFPGHRSYSLESLCQELGIEINGRHRASGDALATVKLFELLLEADEISYNPGITHNSKISKLNPLLDINKLDKLPEEPGVYYFYNDHSDLIYIGKSKNIHQRIMTHLSNNSSKRAMKMRDEIADIDFELTGNELIALLKESEEIKQDKPRYNRAQRRTGYTWGILSGRNDKNYIVFQVSSIKNNTVHPLSVFTSKEAARSRLASLVDKYELCQQLCGLYKSSNGCFHRQVGICRGACTGEENAATYNLRAQKALDEFAFSRDNFFIVDKGRYDEEKSAIKIINGHYEGYGFFDINEMGFGLRALHDCIKPSVDNGDTQVILKAYMKNNKEYRLIRF